MVFLSRYPYLTVFRSCLVTVDLAEVRGRLYELAPILHPGALHGVVAHVLNLDSHADEFFSESSSGIRWVCRFPYPYGEQVACLFGSGDEVLVPSMITLPPSRRADDTIALDSDPA